MDLGDEPAGGDHEEQEGDRSHGPAQPAHARASGTSGWRNWNSDGTVVTAF